MTDLPTQEIADGGVRGYLHTPRGESLVSLALTHGAGGNCSAKLLVDVAELFAQHGVTVLRFDLAFRQARSSGPPHPSRAAADRDSVRAAVDVLRARTAAPILIGGHSYGGRQASMVAAEDGAIAAGLVLMSYPLHPPGKPEKARTAHLPDITMTSLFVSGTKDPFGTPAELEDAIAMVPGTTGFEQITGAGHDLSPARHRAAERTLAAASELFSLPTRIGPRI
ncbi:alpha/beta fold hydrolase [Rhodococcus sp. G-MC3]|uniref:alpha/beta hydrolase family protein n=1 Tax=Rhodococcus sp. G-MC3 TaxID=3046209 RepID=UPI0024BB004E|nr:alpha/beta fold hydrolase [Rhodococcus sp. G-MC3]MDJ0395475.1 alpha/beta fold hydrolase [Rhodococcus sp. G-MC3]